MNIDGVNTLACLKPIEEVNGEIRIYPLPHMPVVKDLVPDLSKAYEQLASIKPWLQRSKENFNDTVSIVEEKKQTPKDREKLDGELSGSLRIGKQVNALDETGSGRSYCPRW